MDLLTHNRDTDAVLCQNQHFLYFPKVRYVMTFVILFPVIFDVIFKIEVFAVYFFFFECLNMR